MLLGMQVSIAGGVYESIPRARALGCNAMQIFSRDPRQWRSKKLKNSDIEEFKLRRLESGIEKVFIHIPYLINLASPLHGLFRGSITAYVQDMREARALGAEYMVTHMGSHKMSGEKRGLKKVAIALNRILELTGDSPVKILLENTSGAGSWLGYTFEHHAAIIGRIEQKQRIGVCLDTCHAYTAGFDLSSEAGYNRLMLEIENTVGLKNLILVHLNDTKDALGSHRDRHEHIGKGKIGIAGFRRIVNDSRLQRAAFILETPKDSETADLRNLKVVRHLMKRSAQRG
ncbi:MAG: deoxyribonuclease IV [Candidatus Omnitrophica bacterium]|jgi:deoxyribonuclease-4|nr:deoxyribonuclease IV [Candidatus Omnitrophota bacterium]